MNYIIDKQIDDIRMKLKELEKSIIGLKALKCPKCNEIVWTTEVQD